MHDHDPTQTSAITALTSIVTFRMARTQNKLNAQITHLLKQSSDLSLVEWRILRILGAIGPATMADVGRAMDMDKGQLSRKSKGMIARGLIGPAPADDDNGAGGSGEGDDSRKQMLRLTPEGTALLARLMPMVGQRIKGLISNVPPHDLEVFFDVLAKIAAAADKRDFT